MPKPIPGIKGERGIWEKYTKYGGQTAPATGLTGMPALLTSLIVEFDVVVAVQRLPVPLNGGSTTAHPDESPLVLDFPADPPGNDGSDNGGVLVLLAGVVVQVADLMGFSLPAIQEGNAVPGVLDEGLDRWL